MEIKTYSDLEVLAYELCDIQFPKEATIHLSDTDQAQSFSFYHRLSILHSVPITKIKYFKLFMRL